MNFEKLWKMNPRPVVPEDMEDFVEFAKEQYKPHAQEYGVNGFHTNDEAEFEDEVESYIGNSMEAILLHKKYLETTKSEFIVCACGEKIESKSKFIIHLVTLGCFDDDLKYKGGNK